MLILAPLLALITLVAGDELPSLDEALHARITETLRTPTDDRAADALYWDTTRVHGEIDLVVDELTELCDDEELPLEERLAAIQLNARLYRRDGERKAALDLFERALELRPDPITRFSRARLLDQLGRRKDATQAYAELASELEASHRDVQLLSALRLRLAILRLADESSSEDEEGALAAFAAEEGRDPALRRRAAIVLGLVGRPAEAIELFEVSGEGSARFRGELRVAEWALAAGEIEAAQQAAWRAREAARLGRDRRYALAILVEAHRADDSLAALIEDFASQPRLDDDARKVWIDLLRETGRIDEALALFRGAAEGRFTVDMRRELLEMCRESGRDDVLREAYTELIAAEPELIEWRAGLARQHLERGDRAAAIAVWQPLIEGSFDASLLMPAAAALDALGLDEAAIECAERCIEAGDSVYEALMFEFGLHRTRGRFEPAEAALERMDALAPPDEPARMQLSEAYERLGKLERALEVLEAVRTARGLEGAAEDLEMHLAWLHGEVGDEELALVRWRELWQRIDSVARRRYVEDRMMTIAARLGRLADLAIELEEKLLDGSADDRDAGLLVRLYTKANDPVSAAEVIEEYMKRTGGDPVKALKEKARVYLSCVDFANFEETIEELIVIDPEGRGDYLRQLAMSHLEQGRPMEARDVLVQLKEHEGSSDSAEFEAGVLALAGLRDEAIVAYRRGIARHPDRIESYLLMGGLMKEAGELDWALGVYQHLAETAEKDDLFTIAIDGLLNLEAPEAVMAWARRLTLERMADRDDKMYLYQLASDLAEQIGEEDDMVRALEAALPISGERRGPLLRELMDMTVAPPESFFLGAQQNAGDASKHLTFGRRLVALGELVPPQVYLDLGQAFLDADEISNAAKTFSLARGLPDHAAFQRQVAGAFERAGYLREALRTYERVLVGRATDAFLYAKVGEMHEQLGNDALARGLYARGIELVLSRRPLATVDEAESAEETKDPWARWETKNVDDFEEHYGRLLKGLLATSEAGPELDELLAAEGERIEGVSAEVRAELARAAAEGEAEDEGRESATLRHFPRLFHRAAFLRRLAAAHGRTALIAKLDRALLELFPNDEGLLADLVRAHLDWGRITVARELIEAGTGTAEQKDELRFLVGTGEAPDSGLLEPGQVVRLILPLWANARFDDAQAILRRADLTSVREADLENMPGLFNAALFLEDGDMGLTLARHWLRALVKHGGEGLSIDWEARSIMGRCEGLLRAEEWKSLCQFLVSLAVDDPERAGVLINLAPELQEDFEEPLLEAEQIAELLEEQAEHRIYGLGPLFQLLPAEERAPTLRKIWPKVAESGRPNFLLQILTSFEEPLGEDFEAFVYESFEEAASELDVDDFGSSHYIQRALENEKLESDLPLRIADLLLEKAPGRKLQVRAARAVLYSKLGRVEEGMRAATETLALMVQPDSNEPEWEVNNARRALLEHFAKEHGRQLLAALDAHGTENGESAGLAELRLEVVSHDEDLEARVIACRAAAEAYPDSKEITRTLTNALRAAGRSREMMEAFERLIELDEDNKHLPSQVARDWERLENPARALAVLRADEEQDDAERGEEQQPEEKIAAATLSTVKSALEDGETERARLDYRRVWRDLKPEEDDLGFIIFFGSDPFAWPEDDEDQEDERRREKRKGGLFSFDEVEEEEKATRHTYDVLASESFGVDELSRQLRTKSAAELESAGKILSGMATALVHRDGAEEARSALIESVREGRAGRLEFGVLLSLLARNPGSIEAEDRALLEDLMRTVNPRDRGQLRKLAGVQAELGEPERASLLYRWTAATPESDPFGGLLIMGFFDKRTTADLIEEVTDKLDGAPETQALESILTWSDPGDEVYSRDQYELLVLETWTEALGAEDALERCRELCTEVHDTSKGVRRAAARLAASMFAHAGEHDAALRALAAGLCKIEPEDLPAEMRRWLGYGRAVGMSHDDLRRLFPRDEEGWKDLGEWLEFVSERLALWVEEERLPVNFSVPARALAALRLSERGDAERARAVLSSLAAEADLNAASQLWIADVARRIGDPALADQLEGALFDAERLVPGRVPERIARLRAIAGPEAALAAGEAIIEWSPHPAVLVELAAAARELGDEERAVEFEARIEAGREAKVELDAWRDEHPGG